METNTSTESIPGNLDFNVGNRKQHDVSKAVPQYLTLSLADEVYGMNILRVREIIEFDYVTSIPMMPEFIVGVLNLRGNVVPVVDLTNRFGGKPAVTTQRSCIIIAEVSPEDSKMDIGLLVDSVDKVVKISLEDIEPAPNFGVKIRSDFIEAMGKVNDDFIVLIDIDCVLSIDELSILAESNEAYDDAVKVNSGQRRDN